MSGSIFEDIKLSWKGQTVLIPARSVLGAIARIEEVITLNELSRHAQSASAPLARIAMAYGRVLRYAGVQVDDDEVYAGMFGGTESHELVAAAISSLLSMMISPEIRRRIDSGLPLQKPVLAKGEQPPGKRQPARSKSSSRRQ